MIYILAGIDCAGKTTIVQALQQVNKFTFKRPFVFVKESYTDNYVTKLARCSRLRELDYLGIDAIYDRATALDDLVYREFNGETETLPDATAAMALCGCTVIYIECDPVEAASRMDARGDELVDPSQLNSIAEQYERVFERLNIKPFRVRSGANAALQVSQIIFRKRPKLAHIVPVGDLDVTSNDQYHMCLAHLVKKDERYAHHYAALANSTKNAKFVLLDNGAAEGEQLSNEELFECYCRINPTEVVLPDTLCDKDDTLRKFNEALDYFAKRWTGRFMAVPQGHTLDEWTECASAMLDRPEVDTIGVSKFLQMECDDQWTRLYAVDRLMDLIREKRRYDVEIHLLGCSESPSVIRNIITRCPFVRGCDSAYGYLCNRAGVEPISATKRPTGEIEFLDRAETPGLSTTLSYLDIATGIGYNGVDSTWY